MSGEAAQAGATPTERRIWVDGDACPRVIKDILYRAAVRARIRVTLVANQALAVPASPFISALQVPRGFDVADGEIIARVGQGDLVVTADIPLADAVIARGARVITPRGEVLDAGSIAATLSLRNFMDTLRSAGVETGGPPPLGQGERQDFARHLDRYLAQA